MATKSNAKLIEEINALELNVDTEGLTNKELVAKLKELKEAPIVPEETTEAEDASEETLPEVEEGPKVYRIVKGKSVTSPRGILSEGDEVKLSDYEEEVFNNLHKKGYIE